MKILVVIVNYRAAALVARCLQTLAGERAALPDLRVVVVDNPGGDDDAQALRTAVAAQRFGDWVEVRAMPRNGGFSYGINAGVQPAITAAIATFSALMLRRRTGSTPITMLASSRAASRKRAISGAVGGTIGRPSVQPLSW